MSESSAEEEAGTLPTEPPPGADPRLGQLVADRYRVVRRLGEGGMGVVYEAEHVLTRRRVALKLLHPHLANSEEAAGRFVREAQAAGALRHPHIVDVLDMGRLPDGALYMALEFLEGRSLAELLEAEGALPLERAVHLLQQACSAVGAAHARGIVHRDLKPDNLFVTEREDGTEHIKVLDFGIAKVLGPDALRMTATHAVMGTPYYMPPEQTRSAASVDHRADVYALGVILFEMLTGRPPFQAETLPELFVRIASHPPPDPHTLRAGLPLGITALLHRTLAKDPDERPQSCEELAAALSELLSGGAHPSPALPAATVPEPLAPLPEAPADTASATGGRRLRAGLALGALVLLGGGAATLLFHGGDAPAPAVRAGVASSPSSTSTLPPAPSATAVLEPASQPAPDASPPPHAEGGTTPSGEAPPAPPPRRRRRVERPAPAPAPAPAAAHPEPTTPTTSPPPTRRPTSPPPKEEGFVDLDDELFGGSP